MQEKPSCERCRKLHALYRTKPDCEVCIPSLLPQNIEVVKVWSLIHDQLIVGGAGTVIALNHLAVWEVIDRYEINNPVECFEKILKIFYNSKERADLKAEMKK